MRRGFLISSNYEAERQKHIASFFQIAPFNLERIESVYPAFQKVPFKEKLLSNSLQRAGIALTEGELGCLLSHREAWHRIITSDAPEHEHFMIFESDSIINDIVFLTEQFTNISYYYDLFFWGAWEGHMQLFRRSIKKWSPRYKVGTPFIKTVYCTYGYSINKKAARLLLERTKQPSYPVDQFKRFISQDEIRIGGIIPEVVCGNTMGSFIRTPRSAVKEFLFRAILDIKNYIICLFK